MVSIIIPVYQVSGFIERCIQSVICQTFTDIECVIVDDDIEMDQGSHVRIKNGKVELFAYENLSIAGNDEVRKQGYNLSLQAEGWVNNNRKEFGGERKE